MCGICGFSWEDKELIRDMVSIQRHRGHDQNGLFTDKNVSLAHSRLSIIDLSVKGKQPMSNEDNSIWIVFNGEIYNFMDLREKLIEQGHRFKSDTDTEVILHAYEEYGEDCISLFNGMFAFAIWDSKKKIFFLARDSVGIKPLYYSIKDNKLIFASEIKAILLCDNIKREIDPTSFYKYLTFRYVPGDRTIFRDIQKLLPGHYLTYRLDSKKKDAIIKQYWDIQFKSIKKSVEAYSQEINNTLNDAICRMLVSDVPLGAFLSGGLDSTYVVGLMKELCIEPVKTFSIGFESTNDYDESKFSRLVAGIYQTDHHEIFLKENSFDLLPKILWHMDEPIADFASIPTYVLSEFAKKKVSVVLTGEGADELFGGYRKYRYLRLFDSYYKAMPLKLRRFFSGTAGILNNSLHLKRVKELHSSPSIPDYYLGLISFFTKSEKEGLCTAPFLGEVSGRPDIETVRPFFGKGHLIDALMALDFKTWLPEDLLMKVDKTTMAHALEARVPYLDSSMIQLASQISPNMKIRLNKEKYILRQAMKHKVPREIYNRKKHGFNVPVHKWLDEGLKDISREILSKKSIERRGFFNYSYVGKILDNYSKSKIYYSRQLWTLLNFEIWARIYLDRADIKNKNISFDDIMGG